MNCNKATVLMSAALDGELSPKEEEELAQHLAECPECRAEFQDAKKNQIIIRERIVRVKAPTTLIESITRLTSITT
ncbi:anti-sigma factor [Chlorobaculum limnaeum]|uniref:Anti-sigma factor n=2 Tax=Chlorobaculum limnaeum TaxID=274537 RepID=A0A1D8CYT1_CHLLM|nr:anti-sigma factor [Chlorobaculum limnaeum]AOS84052.1 anti-sigma factor [Chlorobaculum limnaeum]